MRNARKNSNQSGVAMLLAIFTLLLLTAMGLSLLCAADLETTIAANYRDKQVSMYSALSGLQEARDRLIPSRYAQPLGTACDDPIAIDTRSMGVPSLTDPNSVLYIINPAAGETIAPWDPSPDNKYFDNELCQESILGLTAAAGSCPANSSSVPSGTGWFNYSSLDGTTYNDSLSAAGEYHPVSGGVLPFPLPYKWVRVTVKTDNMTKALVQSTPTGSVVCWDGSHQIPIAGNPLFNSACESTGAIQLSYNGTLCGSHGTVCTFNPPQGTGYTNPVVTISGGGGSGATATAHVSSVGGGQVTSINVTDGGQNYDVPPTVQITGGGGGSGATAVANISSSGASVTSLSSVTQQSPVGCYASSASVSIASVDFVGGGASATVNMTGDTCIAGWTVSLNNSVSGGNGNGNGNGNGGNGNGNGNGGNGNGNGNGQTNPCTAGTHDVSVSGGGGSGFAGSVTLDSTGTKILGYSIVNPGSGYTSAPTGVSISGLSGCTLGYTFTLGKRVQSLTLNSGGGNYDQTPTVTITAPTVPVGQNPPTASATLGPVKIGYVSSVTVLTQGSGYTVPPSISFVPVGAGSGATATASISPLSGGQIDSITLTNAGSGYTSNPSVTISDPGAGAGAVVQAKSSSGTSLGRVYMLTALAVSPGGSKTMSQMEVATPVRLPLTMPGALTIDAPSPTITPSNSINYVIDGRDQNSCGETAVPPKASVGVTDNPSSLPSPTAVDCITSTLGGAPNASCPAAGGVKSGNYTGVSASPDVENVYLALGDLTTPAGCDALATAIAQDANDFGYTYGNNPSCTSQASCTVHLGSYPNDCPTILVNGDFTMGPVTGCGVLLVTGNLTMSGNYDWKGPVFVIGKGGSFTGGGGGNGLIEGSLFVAKNKDSSGNLLPALVAPTISFDIIGGGGNGIRYDHCYSDNMLSALNLHFPPSSRPLKILSVRSIY